MGRGSAEDGSVPPGKDGDHSSHGLGILVVEDHVALAETIATLLRRCGHRVAVASDGLGALQAAQAEPPDVVLLDIGLPGMDGYEVARTLRQQKLRKRPLLIAVTGYQQHAERLRAYEVGMDLHLTKPVSPDELLHVLRRYQQVAAPATR